MGPVWVVPSESHPSSYVVDTRGETETCTCADFQLQRHPCKHIFAVAFARHRITRDPVAAPETLPVTYSQNWSAYNKAQVEEKKVFQQLLEDMCRGISSPPQHRGRPRLALGDVVFAATMKVYTAMSGRRASSDIQDAKSKGHIQHAPHYNSVSSYLNKPELTPILQGLVERAALPLRAVETCFAIDATGFSTSVYERWYDKKYGRKRKSATWLKVHAAVGVQTLIITGVEVTASTANDAPSFLGLLERTAEGFHVEEVSADKAYLAKKHLDAVDALGADAYIPFKTNSTPNDHPTWEKLWHLYNYRKEDFLEHYHKRSNAESAFSALKRLFGSSVRSKKLTSQTNELLCKVLAYNLTCVVHSMFELGVEPTFYEDAA